MVINSSNHCTNCDTFLLEGWNTSENHSSFCRFCESGKPLPKLRTYSKKTAERKRRTHEAAKCRYRYLFKHPCVDCGETDVSILQFDHLRDKIDSIANMVKHGEPVWRIEAEMAKCEVRCGHCHQHKTDKDQNPDKLATIEEVRIEILKEKEAGLNPICNPV